MSEVLSRAQPYIQLEEAMKASSNHSTKSDEGGGKSKSPREVPDNTQEQHRGLPAYKKKAFPIYHQVHSKPIDR